MVEDFEEGLGRWTPVGDAEFAVDRDVSREGAAARITVPRGTEPAYQKLEWRLTDIRYGDEIAVEAWVRTRGVTEGTGAYFALVFLAADGERVGIAHPLMGVDVGSEGWERMQLRASAPKGVASASVDLILHSNGTAWFDDVSVTRVGRLEEWPDLGDAVRTIRVDADDIRQDSFAGVGYHVFFPCHDTSPRLVDTVIEKHWRELSPSFARLTDLQSWHADKLAEVADHMERMKATGTEIYYTTWDPPKLDTDDERAAYAAEVADTLQYLIDERGLDNLRWYCLTNELTLGEWGALVRDLPLFRAYHRAFHAEFARRGLDVGLLATDASPIGNWHTLEWAAENMDDITAIYGGHHYINSRPLDDERFYPWFEERLTWGADLAREKGKGFILGEFGCKQDGRTVDGVKLDRCVYFGTPDEPWVAVQLADAVIAGMNAGLHGLAYWTFMDFPDDYRETYINKWGLFRWSGDDHSTRAHYYGYGLLSRFCRGPARILDVRTDDPYLRAAALENLETGSVTVVVLNRYPGEVPLELALGFDVDQPLRKYLYDPTAVPQHPYGDLQPPSGLLSPDDGMIRDRLGRDCLAVYTTDYDDEAPPPVGAVEAEPEGDGVRLSWAASPAPDLCYYRIYRAGAGPVEPALANRIGSTVATEFFDPDGDPGAAYRVVAVDRSGNPFEE
ncbi:MAG: hypothetical protein GF320_08575 [Armatimonadia bacterium]|nr:hypothetical protein [Armatimonadia bacterium]